MNVYRLSDSASAALVRRAETMSLIVGALAAAVGIFIAFRNAQPASVWPLVFAIPVLIIPVLWGVRRSFRRQQLSWQSFELSLSSEGIRRRMTGYPDIHIRRDEIKRIDEHGEWLVVRTTRPGPGLIIPKGLEGFEEVRHELLSRHHVEKQRGSDHQRLVWSLLTVVATLGAFAVLALSTDPLIVVPLAAMMVIGAGWAIWVVRRSPHIDERTKRTIWFVLLPALAAVIKALSTFGIE